MENSRIEELERLLRIAEQRREEEKQRRKEAEQRREEEKQRRKEAEQRREEAERETRRTTLAEYIEACHASVFTKFAVETDKGLTSKGSITNPRNKLCPARLLPWSDFLEQQRKTFGILHHMFPTQAEAFESLAFLRDLGERISSKKVANERDLEYFQHISVEDPVRSILRRLAIEDRIKDEFDIGSGVTFENHPNAIAEEAVNRQAAQLPPRTPSRAQFDLDQLRPDQICVYRREDGDLSGRSMAYVIEYKAPHKLTPPQLRLGLRQMDIYKEVVNRTTRPTEEDPDALFQYHADRLAAAAIAQTFHYMIHGGLEYGVLTTGETIVFLKIDWANPGTLYYHLAEPTPEVLAHPASFPYCTAVGQVLAFSLMALGSPSQRREHGQDERESAIRGLKTWAEDWEAILRSIPASERNAPPSSPGYSPRTYATMDRSPYPFRPKKNRAAGTERSDVNTSGKDRSPDSSDDEPEAQGPDTPSPSELRSGGRGGQRRRRGLARQPRGDYSKGSSSHRGGGRGRQCCTQKCLLGLVGGGLLDEKCPNVALHRGRSGDVRHPINHAEWLRLLREQLGRTLDDGVVRTWKQGARGVMFQVTLLTHGYTFVAKGTVPAFVGDLEHEAAVYRRLVPLQGVCVPVFLGAIDLRHISRTYYYDLGVRIVYLMFLSWAGQGLDEAATLDEMGNEMGQSPEQELVRSVRALHAMGVAHTDVREPNALWCRETRRVMMIDFERAVLMDPPRPPLTQLVPNKRLRPPEGMASSKAVGQASSGDLVRDRRVWDDMSAARHMFCS